MGDIDGKGLPPSSWLKARLADAGFFAGSMKRRNCSSLVGVAHDCDFDVAAGMPSIIADCAAAVVDIGGKRGIAPPVSLPAGVVTSWVGDVRVGPRQAAFLAGLREAGYLPSVRSGYRSFSYQALLFAERFLAGDAFDRDGRYTAVPPGFSDHQMVDGALDIDAPEFELRLALLRPELPFSLVRPYLVDETVAFEPWHWRCVGAGECEPFPPNDLNRAAIEGLIDFLAGRKLGAVWDEYVFVTGFVPNGASYCIGSNKRSIAASITDAMGAIGRGWAAHYITVCHGFTRVLDDTVRPYDIGSCTLRATGCSSGHRAYLTGQACATHGIHTPQEVAKELNRKGAFPDRKEHFLLSKGASTDVLLLGDDTMLPARCGLPRSLTERQSDLSVLLSNDVLGWLEQSSDGFLPLYRSRDYAKTISTVTDHSRFCALFLLLERNVHRIGNRCRNLRRSLNSIYLNGPLTGSLMKGGEVENDKAPASTAVFLAHALAAGGDRLAGRTLLAAQAATIRGYLSKSAHDAAVDPIFLGHLCHLLYDIGWTDPSTLDECGLSINILVEALPTDPARRLLYSLGVSQVLGLLVALNYDDARRLIAHHLDVLIAHPEPQVYAERGAFSGLESFHSALPLEALGSLAIIAGLSHKDRLVIHRRLLAGLRYLRGLQFQKGSSAFGGRPRLLEGAIRYSTIDHHFRFDYSLHALSAAWAAEDLAKP